MRKSTRTNEQAIRLLMKDLETHEVAILRERILLISEMTRKAVNEKPEDFVGILWNQSTFIRLCDKVDKHLAFEGIPSLHINTAKPS